MIVIDENTKNKHIEKMVSRLVVLRTMLHFSQAELAELMGIGRQTLVSMETGKRKMTWNTFLSLMFIFLQRPETRQLLEVFGIYTEELKEIYTVGHLEETIIENKSCINKK